MIIIFGHMNTQQLNYLSSPSQGNPNPQQLPPPLRMAQTSTTFHLTSTDRNNKYEQMYNNYNLFKYGKVLGKQDRMRAASTSGITRELAEKPAYCNYKERTKQNEKIRKSLERLTERRKELLEKVRKEQQKMMRNTFRR